MTIFFSVFGDDCSLPVNSGICPGSEVGKEDLRYYYSSANMKCTEFPYSGCEGNGNNFQTLEECKRKCQKTCKCE
jgi:hypothetical protein